MSHRRFVKSFLDDPREEQRDACGVGFIAQIKGVRSHQLICDGLEILRRMDHRGGRAADNLTSDGAGIVTQIPHALIQRSALRQGKNLPPEGDYAVCMGFLPQDKNEQLFWQNSIREYAREQNIEVLLTRDVPVDVSVLGTIARSTLPHIQQTILVPCQPESSDKDFDWRLFILRKKLEVLARNRYGIQQRDFYVVSMSRYNVCYKALVTSDALGVFYPDLKNPLFVSAYAMTHLRFSTNTMPAWPLAQPFRTLCHNGEINTLRGNINAMHARSNLLKDTRIQSDLDSMGPICSPAMSDSAMLDNAVEFLLHSGRSLPHVLSMFIPEPWEKHESMEQGLRDFYEYQSYLMEPWDGPALIAFAHENFIGAILDRNGLRPARYWITSDHQVIMASESGVLNRPAESIREKGRLTAGRIFLIDLKEGRIVSDNEIKAHLSSQNPYGQWLRSERLQLEDIYLSEHHRESKCERVEMDDVQLERYLKSFDYSREDLQKIIAPMANEGKEPDGSMGTDTPLAVLSVKRPLLYNYFKQLFAQVTNPPIDAIREELVTSLATHLGEEQNILNETPSHCSVIRIPHPILTDEDLRVIETAKVRQINAKRLDIIFNPARENLEMALERLSHRAVALVRSGTNVLILSDRNLCSNTAAIPALLATSAIHHTLIREGERTRCSLIVESGEPREVHHFALLLGFGAAAVNPYLALSLISKKEHNFGINGSMSVGQLTRNYIKAACDGILKIMSKMGISTLHSYRGGQLFEALGLSPSLVDRYFTWTPSRIGGVDLTDIEKDAIARQHQARDLSSQSILISLPYRGDYHWRNDGEAHLHSPQMIAALQHSVRINSREEFRKFCKTIDDNDELPVNLRSLLSIQSQQNPIPLHQVEPVETIVKRFCTGAMSFGSLSKEAHETIAVAMNRMGARSNSGEGGEDPDRYTTALNGDSRRSAVKQVASARFGVTSSYLVNADELQIKIAQGAKPGEGGQLPGHKVDKIIAKVRNSTPGITLISPPPHHDIYSIEDLAQLIYDLKNANPSARISVKLVSESGIGTIAAGVAKAKADVILVSGYEGGTGASPLTSIRHAGLPWELGLAETHRMLVENQLRNRVILQTDGQLRTPRDIVIATLLGAEEWSFATSALITLGCIMMRKCHLNTCPVGIATQDPELRKKFAGQPESLINYVFLLAEGVREWMADLGFKTISEMVGRADVLAKKSTLNDSRLTKIDLSALLNLPRNSLDLSRVNREKQDHGLEWNLDYTSILPKVRDDLFFGRKVSLKLPICNLDRSVGTLTSSEITKYFGSNTLPEGQLELTLSGSAGQSFMAFAVAGMTALLIGDANDYLCKGLSGAKVVIRPDLNSRFIAEENIICGNTALYGATSGFLYARGRAGERFAVRNSGAHAVIEGVGNHACEYMTGGTVIVLGPVGRNFAAGMSGGRAFIYAPQHDCIARINRELVDVGFQLDTPDEEFLFNQLKAHQHLTSSSVASHILENWNTEKHHFMFVIPASYRALIKQIPESKTEHPEFLPHPVNIGSHEIHGELHG